MSGCWAVGGRTWAALALDTGSLEHTVAAAWAWVTSEEGRVWGSRGEQCSRRLVEHLEAAPSVSRAWVPSEAGLWGQQ